MHSKETLSSLTSGIIDNRLLKVDVTKKLGQGGYGVVYQGKYRGMDAAVKELLIQDFSPKVQSEFESEAKIMLQLRDPSVVHLYGTTQEKPYRMVLEFCALGSLDRYLQKKAVTQVTWDLRFHFATGIASGLYYLHTYKPLIIHGDLKSLNVLLTGDPQRPSTKLADFGLSQLKTETQIKTLQAGSGEGVTLAWAAPELLSASGKKTTATDIYAFGMTLWEIATHRYPYANCIDPVVLRMSVKSGEREIIPENTPPLFAQVMTDCWSQKSHERPSAEVVLGQLQAYEGTTDVESVASEGTVGMESGSFLASSSDSHPSMSPHQSGFLNSSDPGMGTRKIVVSDKKASPLASVRQGRGLPVSPSHSRIASYSPPVSQKMAASPSTPGNQLPLSFHSRHLSEPLTTKSIPASSPSMLPTLNKSSLPTAKVGHAPFPFYASNPPRQAREETVRAETLSSDYTDPHGQGGWVQSTGQETQEGGIAETLSSDYTDPHGQGVGRAKEVDEQVALEAARQYIVEGNYTLAFTALEKLTSPVACVLLGLLYDDYLEPRDPLQAQAYYEKAQALRETLLEHAQAGDPLANYSLAVLAIQGTQSTREEIKTAVDYYCHAMAQGDVLATYALGRCYQEGKGVAVSKAAAVEAYRTAAQAGYAPASYQLGLCYERGEGVTKDIGIAFSCYETAAHQGYAPAQNSMGACYETGQGVKPDVMKALNYYEQAASQGSLLGLHNLGVVYENGRPGIPKNPQKAVECYTLAAAKGFARSQNNLARFYETGEGGVEQNLSEATRYYRLAADQGYARAQYNVGVCYEQGRGIEIDLNAAKHYYTLAAKANERISPTAQQSLERLVKQGSPVKSSPVTSRTPFWSTPVSSQTVAPSPAQSHASFPRSSATPNASKGFKNQ